MRRVGINKLYHSFVVFFSDSLYNFLPCSARLWDKSPSSTNAADSAGGRKVFKPILIIFRLLRGKQYLKLHAVSIDIAISFPYHFKHCLFVKYERGC